ncbi:hypothetical protein [Nonomuraea dietziae]|uniref:hypothetical protein n=1 Tax=Nonomuraea dietziae TaxID=65515 RepID=UPI0031CF3FD8
MCCSHPDRPYGRRDRRPREEAVGRSLRSIVGTYGIASRRLRAAKEIVVAGNGSPIWLGAWARRRCVARPPTSPALVATPARNRHLEDGSCGCLNGGRLRDTFVQRRRETAKERMDRRLGTTGHVQTTPAVYESTTCCKEISEQPRVDRPHAARPLDERFHIAAPGRHSIMDARERPAPSAG